MNTTNRLLTPREWQRYALAEAAALCGTDEYPAKAVEAARFGALALEIEVLNGTLGLLAAHFDTLTKPPTRQPEKIVCYSADDGENCYRDLSSVIDGSEHEVGDKYYEYDALTLVARDAVCHSAVDNLIEDMENRLYDDVGEAVEGVFSGVSPEAKLELDAFLLSWVERHSSIGNFFKVVSHSPREREFTAEELA